MNELGFHRFNCKFDFNSLDCEQSFIKARGTNCKWQCPISFLDNNGAFEHRSFLYNFFKLFSIVFNAARRTSRRFVAEFRSEIGRTNDEYGKLVRPRPVFGVLVNGSIWDLVDKHWPCPIVADAPYGRFENWRRFVVELVSLRFKRRMEFVFSCVILRENEVIWNKEK